MFECTYTNDCTHLLIDVGLVTTSCLEKETFENLKYFRGVSIKR
jgi:hypothetical protein